MSDTGVEKKQRSPQGSRGLTLIELLVIVAFIGILAAIAIPNLIQASRYCRSCFAAADTKHAVTQAVVYANDRGVYPTSLRWLRATGYANVPDADHWGNEYVLSPVLIQGGRPKEGDNVYVFSRGPKGTGVIPQPFTSHTGVDGSIGYSSVDGFWGPSHLQHLSKKEHQRWESILTAHFY